MEHMHNSYVYIFSCCMRQPHRRLPAPPVKTPPALPQSPPQPVAMDKMIDLALMFPLQAGMFPMKAQKVSFVVSKITKSCSLSDMPSATQKVEADMFPRWKSSSLWVVRGEIRAEFLRELKEKSRHPKYTLLRALRKRKQVSRTVLSGVSCLQLCDCASCVSR